ncbi:MAG: hypothetical protein EZS28_041122, partial [Streblomastix strix]
MDKEHQDVLSLFQLAGQNKKAVDGMLNVCLHDRAAELLDKQIPPSFPLPQNKFFIVPETVLLNVMDILDLSFTQSNSLELFQSEKLRTALEKIKTSHPSMNAQRKATMFLSYFDRNSPTKKRSKQSQNSYEDQRRDEYVSDIEHFTDSTVQAIYERMRVTEERAKAVEVENQHLREGLQRLRMQQNPYEEDYQVGNVSTKYTRLDELRKRLRRVTALKDGFCCIPIDLIVYEGIYKCEIEFSGNNNIDGRGVGIMRAHLDVPYPCAPWEPPNRDYMLHYSGYTGATWHKGDNTPGNGRFEDDVHVIGMEVNMKSVTMKNLFCGNGNEGGICLSRSSAARSCRHTLSIPSTAFLFWPA